MPRVVAAAVIPALVPPDTAADWKLWTPSQESVAPRVHPTALENSHRSKSLIARLGIWALSRRNRMAGPVMTSRPAA